MALCSNWLLSDDYRLTCHGPAALRLVGPLGLDDVDARYRPGNGGSYNTLRRVPLRFQGLREVDREQNASDNVSQYSHRQQCVITDSRHPDLPVIQEHLGSVPTHKQCDMPVTAFFVKKCQQPVKMRQRFGSVLSSG